ncbi:plasmid pRiA4b ORF-3 family protein [Nonomuraea sp. ZG12]|uniref:plasmid pRiA4b ORF-3 family protein n=1 Tax=Nonomuraea sp. ZG12 TaxID=3452207 RepID=UPI003F8C7A79
MATLDQLHEVIQVAMGWQQHHLHLFGKGDAEYGDNARDETKVMLAALIPRVGDWLGYRYDMGDMWDHDLVVEKVHRQAAKAVYPRCSAGGRACPPEDSGGPEGYFEHMRALRHRKGWKYRVAKEILGSTKWDPAKWDRGEVNAGLARLAKLWAKQAVLVVKAAAADQAATETATKASTKTTKKAAKSPAATAPRSAGAVPAHEKSRPGNGSFAGRPLRPRRDRAAWSRVAPGVSARVGRNGKLIGCDVGVQVLRRPWAGVQ